MASGTVYWTPQCPNCTRFVKSVRRLNIDAKLVDISATPVQGLTAVPTVVTAHGQTLVGTKAFEWLQHFEDQVPLDAYAMVLGEGTGGGLVYTDLDTDEPVAETPFTSF